MTDPRVRPLPRLWRSPVVRMAGLLAILLALSSGVGSATGALLVSGAKIKDGTLTGADVRGLDGSDFAQHSLTSSDFQDPVALAGPAGPAGAAGQKGPKGDTGATGATGRAGTPAYRGVRYETNVSSAYPGASNSQFVTCSVGRAVAGGVEPSANDVAVSKSVPVLVNGQPTSRWEIRTFKSGMGTASITLWAVCLL